MITVEEIKKLAGLAKFSLEGENLDELAEDIGQLASFAHEISDIDLSGMDLSKTDEIAPLREDIVIPSLSARSILQNARESHDGYFVARG